ncbi:MAG TPA: ACP S-malonyltransferase [Deltaproteobacteria bacterium]|nr:ACP S-malonyltransferase [Deltaproteobacteria bacterium]HPR54576.1 ACP S-malonyltransferase [Deltaproteobacteria bacterium]HXK48006.1 ACP S-malonyltransferase [Deltaproteobacteria bacterium]
MAYCLIFPGQGSQFPGMSRGLDLDRSIQGELRALMENGPEDLLGETVNAQPAILSVCAALWERSGLTDPAAVLGHSLGEYTALVAAGCLTTSEAVRLVTKRAEFMDASRPRGEGCMAAVLGLAHEKVEQVVSGLPDLWVANLNGASQVVISGSARSMDAAAPILREKGAKRLVPLKVSLASHCPYMDRARKDLGSYLEEIDLGTPRCPVISNASAAAETEPGRIKSLLADQLTHPVRFEESVLEACSRGIDHFIEIGPRSVLAPLVRRIAPGVKVEVIANDGH